MRATNFSSKIWRIYGEANRWVNSCASSLQRDVKSSGDDTDLCGFGADSVRLKPFESAPSSFAD
jgi:hypothetical protein